MNRGNLLCGRAAGVRVGRRLATPVTVSLRLVPTEKEPAL
jgi:hypothetical protein